MIHAVGMITTLRVTRALNARAAAAGNSFLRGVRLLVIASWMIVLTHSCEVMVWGAFFTWHKVFSWSTANYYALLQYTSVGSELSLPFEWRLLGGMLPMAGMLTFAWSTAVLLSLVVVFEEVRFLHPRDGGHKGKAPTQGPPAT